MKGESKSAEVEPDYALDFGTHGWLYAQQVLRDEAEEHRFRKFGVVIYRVILAKGTDFMQVADSRGICLTDFQRRSVEKLTEIVEALLSQSAAKEGGRTCQATPRQPHSKRQSRCRHTEILEFR